MWQKIENKSNPKRRTGAVVRKRKTGFSIATLELPREMVSGDRADIFQDGTRIGFLIGNTGDYAVQGREPKRGCRRITIPHRIAAAIPAGSTSIALTEAGGMLVLDLASLAA